MHVDFFETLVIMQCISEVENKKSRTFFLISMVSLAMTN